MKKFIIFFIAILCIVNIVEARQVRFFNGFRRNAGTVGNCPNCRNGVCPVNKPEAPKKEEIKKEEQKEEKEIKKEEVKKNDGGTGQSVSEDISGKRQKAECLIRGNAVVSTYPEYKGTGDEAVIEAANLPDDDFDKFYCMIFHKEGDTLSKQLLDDWKKNENLCSFADPLNPTGKTSICKFLTINVDDETAQDLVKANNVTVFPTVVVQTANVEVGSIPSKTKICQISGYDKDITNFSKILIGCFKKGLKLACEGKFEEVDQSEHINVVGNTGATDEEIGYTPNIPVKTTLELQKDGVSKGININVELPEESKSTCNSITDFFNGLSDPVKYTFIFICCFIILCIIQKIRNFLKPDESKKLTLKGLKNVESN